MTVAESIQARSEERTARDARAYPVAKRWLDVLVASLLLLVALPLLLAAAAAVKLTSPGPVLFRQSRVGHHGSSFTMLKLRSMRAACDDSAHRDYVTRLLTDPSPPD